MFQMSVVTILFKQCVAADLFFVLAALITWTLIQAQYNTDFISSMILGGALIAGISFIDDIRGLSIRLRLSIHVLGALIFLAVVPTPAVFHHYLGTWAWLWYPVAAFFMVAVTNLYNFIDGIDGLVSLQTLCAMGCWIVYGLASSSGISAQTLLCLGVCVPLLAFLVHNWSPARVFMGDVGSTFLGFTFGALAVIQVPGVLRSTNFFVLIILMMPVLFDATFTLLVRLLKGEKWYMPHREHIFQRLVACGYSHAYISFMYGMLTICMGMLLVLANSGLLRGIYGACLFMIPYVLLYAWVRQAELQVQRQLAPVAQSPSILLQELEVRVYKGEEATRQSESFLTQHVVKPKPDFEVH